jgi:hypothetical protein
VAVGAFKELFKTTAFGVTRSQNVIEIGTVAISMILTIGLMRLTCARKIIPSRTIITIEQILQTVSPLWNLELAGARYPILLKLIATNQPAMPKSQP